MLSAGTDGKLVHHQYTTEKTKALRRKFQPRISGDYIYKAVLPVYLRTIHLRYAADYTTRLPLYMVLDENKSNAE